MTRPMSRENLAPLSAGWPDFLTSVHRAPRVLGVCRVVKESLQPVFVPKATASKYVYFSNIIATTKTES